LNACGFHFETSFSMFKASPLLTALFFIILQYAQPRFILFIKQHRGMIAAC